MVRSAVPRRSRGGPRRSGFGRSWRWQSWACHSGPGRGGPGPRAGRSAAVPGLDFPRRRTGRRSGTAGTAGPATKKGDSRGPRLSGPPRAVQDGPLPGRPPFISSQDRRSWRSWTARPSQSLKPSFFASQDRRSWRSRTARGSPGGLGPLFELILTKLG